MVLVFNQLKSYFGLYYYEAVFSYRGWPLSYTAGKSPFDL